MRTANIITSFTITILLLLLHSVPTASLTIQIANQQHNFTSYYSTLGSHQLHQYKYNFTLLYANNITDNCHLNLNKTTVLKNSLLVIYGSLHNIPACASDVYGKHTAIARLAQVSGFAGVITQSEELVHSFPSHLSFLFSHLGGIILFQYPAFFTTLHSN
jgi:hypothetical protein